MIKTTTRKEIDYDWQSYDSLKLLQSFNGETMEIIKCKVNK